MMNLQTPDGRIWHGMSQKFYRLDAQNGERGRKVQLKPLEEAVLNQVQADTQSLKFIAALAKEARLT